MCYPKPGPRCSYHVLHQLQRAQAAGNTNRAAELQQAFYLTPKGITDLRAQGRFMEADIAAHIRRRQLATYRAAQQASVAQLEARVLRSTITTEDINAALDSIEAQEQSAVISYALTH